MKMFKMIITLELHSNLIVGSDQHFSAAETKTKKCRFTVSVPKAKQGLWDVLGWLGSRLKNEANPTCNKECLEQCLLVRRRDAAAPCCPNKKQLCTAKYFLLLALGFLGDGESGTSPGWGISL